MYHKVGEYMKKNRLTVAACFNLIDKDSSQTISVDELFKAFSHFDLGIPEREVRILVDRIDSEKTGTISKQAFLRKFWTAFTFNVARNS